eukprot:782501-Prymnesium_polylepis.1
MERLYLVVCVDGTWQFPQARARCSRARCSRARVLLGAIRGCNSRARRAAARFVPPAFTPLGGLREHEPLHTPAGSVDSRADGAR